MKVSSHLLTAMLVTATLGVAATSCKSSQPRISNEENYQAQGQDGFFGRIKDFLTRDGFSCDACGKG